MTAFSGAALTHSFYPYECCSDKDCWATGEGGREPDPIYTRDGWLLADGTLVPFDLAQPSPDGLFHVCRHGGRDDASIIRPDRKKVCLFVPPFGS